MFVNVHVMASCCSPGAQTFGIQDGYISYASFLLTTTTLSIHHVLSARCWIVRRWPWGPGILAYEPTFEKNPERLDGQKHFSIDLSLELERQLELEGSSLPATPSSSKNPHSYAQPNPDTLDPQILVHIITGLRKTIEDMTKERDDLIKMIEDSTTREATLQDTLALMTEKATNYEEELSAAKKKMKEDEEAITLLRTKVEESR